MFVWMEATKYQHLPVAGGLLDQDELLMDNIFYLMSAVSRIRLPKVT